MEYWDMKLLLEGGDGGEGWWAEIRNVEFGLLFALKCQHHTRENNQWMPSARAPPGTFQLTLHMQNSAPLCNTTPSTRLCWFCSKRIGFEGRWPASGSYVRWVALTSLSPSLPSMPRGKMLLSHRIIASVQWDTGSGGSTLYGKL